MINLKLILTSLILFSTLFSNIIIKTGNNEIKLKKGMLFSINSDKTKITYNSFNENLINNSIDVNSIEKITIYNYKKKSNTLSRRILITGMALTSYVAFTKGDGATLLSKPKDIFQIGGTITLILTVIGSVIEKNTDKSINIKNQNCTNQLLNIKNQTCTKWILVK